MPRIPSRLIADRGGAVASTVALSLFALIAIGGVAFDYARMASLDTELQNAADQAALAGVSQLDGKAGACARAATAANSMVTNRTLMANDGAASGTTIVIPLETGCDAVGSIRFYQDKAKTSAATSDVNAKFLEVSVTPRAAFYALTPIVAAFTSGQLNATAFAGLGGAVCRVPPLMLCNPNEATDPTFTIANYVGKGIRLIANDGGGTYGPGNFGFLDVGAGNGAAVLREQLGRLIGPGDCVAEDGVATQTGSIISVRDALNTRFDIYDNGLNQTCGANGSLCPPSINTRKDLVRKGNGNGSCGFATGGGNGWREASNTYPNLGAVTPRDLTETEITTVSPMGYPRDKCHAFTVTGSCAAGRIGDGDWDRYAYFRSNPTSYPMITSVATMNTFLNDNFSKTNPSRYEVYVWEMADAAARASETAGPGLMSHSVPVCAASGIAPSATAVDRRVISAAVINCTAEGVSGHTTGIQVTKWIDMFLVEPSVPRTRTENSDVYVELIGGTDNATDEGAVQLFKKSVPYLIE